jgi:hypothetical protein
VEAFPTPGWFTNQSFLTFSIIIISYFLNFVKFSFSKFFKNCFQIFNAPALS